MPAFCMTVDEGLELRLLEPRHAEMLFDLVEANRSSLRPWLPWVDATQQPGDIRVFIRTGLKQFAEGRGFHAGIFAGPSIIGVVGFHPIDKDEGIASLGYWLAESHRGRGIMTRCVRVLADHAFRDLGLHRLEIRCAPDNAASRAIPERLGFSEEGTLRQCARVGDRRVDHVVYGMLRHEWNGEEE